MRKTLIVAAFALLATASSAVAADTTPSPEQVAKAACQDEKRSLSTKVFKQTYAAKSTAKAMSACIAKREPAAADATQNAAQACKAERAADATAFAEQYGTNKNKKNAYGKCVSSKAQEETEEQTEARVNAAKTCKALRKDDAEAFGKQYGTGKNAFGKCVSQTAKADDEA